MNATTTTPSPARARSRKLLAESTAQSVDDDAAVTIATHEILTAGTLQAADHYDLFAGAPVVADQIDAVSARFGAPSTAATLLALTFFSIGCLDRVRVSCEEYDEPKPFTHPLHLFTLCELMSGVGKSAAAKAMGLPNITRLSRRVNEAWAAVEARDEDRREQAEKKKTAKGATEAERIAARLELKRPKLRSPAPMLDQVTPEEFGWRSLQSGYTFIATAEGRSFFDNFVFGRDLACVTDVVKGFSGDAGKRSTRKDEAAGNAPLFDEYHTSIVLLNQVGNLSPAQLVHRQRLAGAASQGLLARFIIGRHAGDVPSRGRRTHDDLSRIERNYEALLECFLCVPEVYGNGFDEHPCAPRNAEGEYAGQWVYIRGDAARMLIDFQRKHKDANRDADADPVGMLLNRCGEIAMRVAGLLALARAGGIPALKHGEVLVTVEEAARAIRFIERVHIPHGLSLLDQTTAGEVESLTTRILSALANLTKPVTLAVFKNSHARRWPEVRGRALRDKCPLKVVFDDLVLRGLVTHKATFRSETYELSPAGRGALRGGGLARRVQEVA